jgi:hypothetical protein
MEMGCADCGCLVADGIRIIPCDTDGCCCTQTPVANPMDVIAARLRVAFNTRDMDTFRSLIDENARWGEDLDHARTCLNRDDIVRTFKRRLDEGVRGNVVETMTGPRGVACLVEIEWPDPGHRGRGPRFYQVFLVADGLVTRIEGHDDQDTALAAIAN